ncbi:MAG: DUF177 domain-containing protein [Bacteroidota bacterium]
MIEYIIPIASLKQGLYEYDFEVTDGFFQHFEDSLLQKGTLKVRLELEKRSGLIELQFDIQGSVITTCDRCLEEMAFPIDENQHMVVKYSDELEDDLEVSYIPFGTEMMDVSKFIYEYIHLAIPMAKTHEDIGEDCPVHLEDFLDEDDTADDNAPSVWDALKNINTN